MVETHSATGWTRGRTEQTMMWAPSACTLPIVERPLRVAEFDELFATALRGQTRLGPTRLQLILDHSDQVEATTRDLIARETACCSFFTFSLTLSSDGQLLLDIQVPANRTGVLEGLAARAMAATSGTG
jgi:hypothetical protein